jgi:hypothetical protein
VSAEEAESRETLWKAIDMLGEALRMYADPTFYHAITIIGDRPTGGFDEDVSMTEEYDYPKPGKLARETLAAVAALSSPAERAPTGEKP